MRQVKRYILMTATAVNALVIATSAYAQESNSSTAPTQAEDTSDSGALVEVVVTARKRSENLQRTALAVTALSGDDLADKQISSVVDLANTVPNVDIGTALGNVRISIRGLSFDSINTGSEARTAFHVDGVYFSRPATAAAGFFDVSRVEVLRGPQGTLYGRNATAGTVNVITADPTTTLNGFARLTVGNYNLVRVEGAISDELAPGVAARVAFLSTDRDGYGSDPTNGFPVDDEHSRGVRGKLRVDLASNARLLLAADYFTGDDHAFGLHYAGGAGFTAAGVPIVPVGPRFGGTPATDPRDVTADSGPLNKREYWGTSATLNWDLGAVELVSLTAYRHSTYQAQSDNDGTNAPLAFFDQFERARQVSEELRLQGGGDALKWLLGGYYFDERVTGHNAIPLDARLGNAAAAPRKTQGYFAGGSLSTRAYAIFGQVEYRPLDKLSLIVAGRYSGERKGVDEVLQIDLVRDFNPSNPVIPNRGAQVTHVNFTNFSPKVSIEYRPTENAMAYVLFSKGFKSGGYNLGGIQPPFQPEKLTDYEAGLKIEWFDRRLRTNFAVFDYEYSNLQVSRLIATTSITDNAARARVRGFEAEVTARPVDNLTLEFNLALLDAKYREYITSDAARPGLGVLNLAGNRLTQSPKYTVNVAAQYVVPLGTGEITL